MIHGQILAYIVIIVTTTKNNIIYFAFFIEKIKEFMTVLWPYWLYSSGLWTNQDQKMGFKYFWIFLYLDKLWVTADYLNWETSLIVSVVGLFENFLIQ